MAKSGVVPIRGRTRLFLAILISATFALSGCDKLRELAHGPQIIKKQQKEITALQAAIHRLQQKLDGVRQDLKSQNSNIDQKFTAFDSSLNSLATKYAGLDSYVNEHKTSVFQNNSKSVQRLDTNLGSFFIFLDGITANGDHSELTLHVGNPYMFEISGFSLHLTYGDAFDPSGHVSYDDWQKSLKSTYEPFKEHLKPGQWNKIEVSLGKTNPDEVKYIAVTMVVDDVVLRQKQK